MCQTNTRTAIDSMGCSGLLYLDKCQSQCPYLINNNNVRNQRVTVRITCMLSYIKLTTEGNTFSKPQWTIGKTIGVTGARVMRLAVPHFNRRIGASSWHTFPSGKVCNCSFGMKEIRQTSEQVFLFFPSYWIEHFIIVAPAYDIVNTTTICRLDTSMTIYISSILTNNMTYAWKKASSTSQTLVHVQLR